MTTLVAEDVTVSRGGRRALDAVSATFPAGAFVGVVGPNGAGKSTLLRVLAGLEAPVAGRVLLDEDLVGALAPPLKARRIAYLPQHRPVHAAIDAETVVALGRFAYGAPTRLDAADRAAVDAAMTDAGVRELAQRSVATLSGGELARVHLARLLAAGTPVVIADEPVAALDPRHQLAIMTRLKACADAGGVVVAAMHEIGLVRRFCSHALLLREGRAVASGPPDTLTGSIAGLFSLDENEARFFFADVSATSG